jgi:glycolate oxidase FAD binding subunit
MPWVCAARANSNPARSPAAWHGALRWLWAPASAGAQLRALAQQLGGHATLQRASLAAGDADKLLAGVFTPLAPVQDRIQRALQQQFDPAGVFATGRGGL